MTTPSTEHVPFPRVYLVRHGATEWSKSGKHTGRTDIPLTDEGIEQAHLLSQRIFENPNQDLVHIENITLVLVSPLLRAQQTYEQLHLGGLAREARENSPSCFTRSQARIMNQLQEFDYGDYEGLKTSEIQINRPGWNLFDDNVPNGETVQDVSKRCDAVIEMIHNYQRGIDSEGNEIDELCVPVSSTKGPTGYLNDDQEASISGRPSKHSNDQLNSSDTLVVPDRSMDSKSPLRSDREVIPIPVKKTRDVLIVAHSHVLRIFAARWLRLEGSMGRHFVLDPSGLSVLGYEHNLQERCIKSWNFFIATFPGRKGE